MLEFRSWNMFHLQTKYTEKNLLSFSAAKTKNYQHILYIEHVNNQLVSASKEKCIVPECFNFTVAFELFYNALVLL